MNPKLKNPFKLSFESLEEFADAIRQALQCPITIEDANHRLLAYSFHDEKTDPARISTIISRRVPEKVINQLWKEGVIPALLSTTEPIRVKCMNEIGLGNRVAISIWKQKEVIGFIWALEVDQALHEDQMDLLKKAAEAATNELLQLQVRNRKKEDHFQEFFWQLLTGHLTKHDEIIEHFHTFKITPSPSFAVMVFQFQQNITRKLEQQISYLLKTSQQLKIILYTFDGSLLILLVSPPNCESPVIELDHFIDTFKGNLRDRYKITEVQPGVSNLYEGYQKVKKAYQESLTVLATKEKFHLYDQKHNSNLVETLEVYLDKDTNVTEAANELVVHPNTLTYRLKRITEISEIDFKDPNQKMMLYMDIKLEKYLDR